MKKYIKFFCLISVFFLLTNCISKIENEKREKEIKEAIIGDWDFMYEVPKNEFEEELPNPSPAEYNSMSISNDSIESYLGYFDFNYDSKNKNDGPRFYGNFTTYKLKGDSLIIKNPIPNKKDYKWKFERRIKDTIEFRYKDSTLVRYQKINPRKENLPKFDQIIISTSPCFGTCSVYNISIDKKGKIFFQGEHFVNPQGFYYGQLDSKNTAYIFDKFQKANPIELKNKYTTDITDGQSFNITLIQNGKIVKTIDDYRFQSPKELIWAYLPSAYMYQLVQLNQLTKATNDFVKINYQGFIKGNKTLRLEDSNAFYLWTELQKSKLVKKDFKPKYEVLFYQDDEHPNKISLIETDGQFYEFKFENNESIILDLGYNFVDLNLIDVGE